MMDTILECSKEGTPGGPGKLQLFEKNGLFSQIKAFLLSEIVWMPLVKFNYNSHCRVS